MLFIIDGGVYSLMAPLTGKILDKGTDALSVLGVGSFIICLGYLLLAPVPPFLIQPSLEQIAIGRFNFCHENNSKLTKFLSRSGYSWCGYGHELHRDHHLDDPVGRESQSPSGHGASARYDHQHLDHV